MLVILWDVATCVFDWEPWLVPPPADVAEALWDYRALLPEHTWVTVWESLAGFVLAIAVGIPLGGLIAYSRLMELTVYPILLGLNAVPKIAIAPILILWMGLGLRPEDPRRLPPLRVPDRDCDGHGAQADALRARGACALPLRLGVADVQAIPVPERAAGDLHRAQGGDLLAVIGAVIGEFVGASEGLGWVIVNSGANVNTSLAFAAMAILAAVSVVLFYAIALVERPHRALGAPPRLLNRVSSRRSRQA